MYAIRSKNLVLSLKSARSLSPIVSGYFLPYRAPASGEVACLPNTLPCRHFTSKHNQSTSFNRQLALVGGALLLGAGAYLYVHHDTDVAPTITPQAQCDKQPKNPSSVKSSNRQFNFIAEAVERASPSVVSIEVSHSIETFFGSFSGTVAGSGFVVENGRHVLTNAHVVGNTLGLSVDIKLISGKVVKGEVTDIDEVADLAIIKLDLPSGTFLPPLKFGNSNDLRPGEWVVAMGSPLALTNTITCGIVSSLHRPSADLGLTKTDMEYVQTDAAITLGNSGGPLVNLDGDVIGVNTMTAAPGISFAIPSTIAQNFVRSANKNAGKMAEKKYAIGVSMLTLNPHIMSAIQQYFSIPRDLTGGVLLTKVWPHSPAYLAGLRRGDVVVRINGEEILSNKDMYRMVRSGKKLSVEFYRKLQYMTCTVVPETMN